MGVLGSIRDRIKFNVDMIKLQMDAGTKWTERLTTDMRVAILEEEKTLNQALILVLIASQTGAGILHTFFIYFFGLMVAVRIYHLWKLLRSIRTFLEKPEIDKGVLKDG